MCYASLWHADRDEEVMALKQDRHRGRSLLTGTIVVSMARLRDVNNVDSSFFPFTAIGVAVEGTFRLMFTLFEISGGAVHCRGRVYSESFVVYGRGFPGLGESTPLCRALAEQGVRIRLRNESKLRRYCGTAVYSIISNMQALTRTPQSVFAGKHSSANRPWRLQGPNLP
ncbi:velvet factor-domain-containing protein [Fimicolochytrium jonesii]|uniref:velvet factor-domain-containing protein n=1 Tax=Fimicolochytrium jonesii TaxID=1396493 RepID=UPI0022FE02B5|nr:velvet factor-domain-containing protein [Fimicolochytrium jonesii]KAI8826634.1 velvet factor-domain-containing protein [Fimicolochytrium jonesii]